MYTVLTVMEQTT